MGESGSGGCLTCSRAVHMILAKNSNDVKLRLLEQTFCAHCWRPLSVSHKWPEPRESLLPPYGNGRFVLISACGHVFHGGCAVKATRCSKCLSTIQNLLPLHVRETKDPPEKCLHGMPQSGVLDPTTDRQEPREPSVEVHRWIAELRDQLGVISGELVQIRRQLAKPVQQPRKWR